ncbi:polysaccharide deacetylase family protein [Actinoplanes sp. NPDC051513]|uniref:polysaccharide deacetylase family protein n=1 Tax=Actinoplanes sp. NPDC051513 TaxID=3363908 RepID=UPI0037AA6FBB
MTARLLGRMAEELPDVARAIVDAGHEVGVHGYEDLLLVEQGPAVTCHDISRAIAAITADERRTAAVVARSRW